jgi:DNA-directed RNA polymerase specialized sigma24 family protein
MTGQSEDDDEALAIRMMDRDKEALRLILKRHTVPVSQLLTKTYPFVQQVDIDDALIIAAAEMWDKADQYDKERADIVGWFFVIAQSRLLDILSKQKTDRERCKLVDPNLSFAKLCKNQSAEMAPPSAERKRRLLEMAYVIDKLAPMQKAIILADLALGEPAEAAALAEQLGTTKESIYVSRNKAHENIRKRVLERERRGETLRGK